jgi:hypothetical protein
LEKILEAEHSTSSVTGVTPGLRFSILMGRVYGF